MPLAAIRQNNVITDSASNEKSKFNYLINIDFIIYFWMSLTRQYIFLPQIISDRLYKSIIILIVIVIIICI
ncbi:hypothetical protein B4907_03710 [Yersinia kristensenii]|nr:hypothetical protein B4907_03710 [Yersinia kristensenii]